MDFVGRRRELAVLDAALDAALAGQPRLLLVGGEPGIGKTRLVDVWSAGARKRAPVVWGRAWDWGGAPAYWPFVQIIREIVGNVDDDQLAHRLGRGVDVISQLVPEIASRLPDGGETAWPDPAAMRFQLFEAVARFITRSAPVVLVLDDLHAADPATIDLLHFLARSRGGGVLMVGTHRTVDAPEEWRRRLPDVLRDAQAITLEGLDEPAIREILEHSQAAGELASRLRAHTAGNPLFIDGVLRAVAQGGWNDTRWPLSPDVKGAITGRLSRLDSQTRRVLAAAAVVGRPCTLALLGRILDQEIELLLAIVSGAIQAGLLREAGDLGHYTFFHALVRELTYEQIDPAERIRLHARIAEALERLYGADRGPHLPELARHFFKAAPLGFGGRALSLSRAAGERAMALAAFEDAAQHFQQALEASDYAASDRAPLLNALAEARLASGHSLAARELFEQVAESARDRGDATLLGIAALGVARTYEFGVAEPKRLALLEEAVARLRPNDSPVLARVLARLAMELWMVSGREADRSRLAEEAVQMAERFGDPELHAFTLNAWLQSAWGPEYLDKRQARARELRRLAEKSGHLERLLEAHRWRINAAVEAGAIAEAESSIADYRRVADALHRPQFVGNALLRETMIEQLRGNFERASELAAATRDMMLEAGDPQAEVVFDSRTTLAAVENGRVEVLAQLLPRMRAHAHGRPHLPLYRAVYIQGLLAVGEEGDARAEWEQVWQRPLGRDMMLIATAALLTPSCVRLRDVERAKELLARLRPFEHFHAAIGASYSLGSAARYVGLLAEMLGDRAEAVHAFSSALAMNQRMGALPQAQCAAADLARVSDRPPAPVEKPVDARRGVMRDEGAVWLIEYAGKQVRIKSSVGLKHLRKLIERPGVEVHVLELIGAESVDLGDSGPALDARAKREYRERMGDLREMLDEADAFGDRGRAARAQRELEQLTEELARATGLGGRDRTSGSAGDRARHSVLKAIQRAIKSLSESLPDLGRHLENSVKTGSFCRYDPEPAARAHWSF